MFAQETIKFDEVATDLAETERAIGSPSELASFFSSTLTLSGAVLNPNGTSTLTANLTGIKPAVRESLGDLAILQVAFEPVTDKRFSFLHRTHPLVEGLANYILNSALDPLLEGLARRAGVIRTKSVQTRTTLILLRLRFHIITSTRDGERHLLAEDAMVAGFTGEPTVPTWLTEGAAEHLLNVRPDATVPPDIAVQQLESLTEHLSALNRTLDQLARNRGQQLLEAHERVRQAARSRGRYRIDHSPPDILGIYIFLPVVNLA
jgi:hypothetical protein